MLCFTLLDGSVSGSYSGHAAWCHCNFTTVHFNSIPLYIIFIKFIKFSHLVFPKVSLLFVFWLSYLNMLFALSQKKMVFLNQGSSSCRSSTIFSSIFSFTTLENIASALFNSIRKNFEAEERSGSKRRSLEHWTGGLPLLAWSLCVLIVLSRTPLDSDKSCLFYCNYFDDRLFIHISIQVVFFCEPLLHGFIHYMPGLDVIQWSQRRWVTTMLLNLRFRSLAKLLGLVGVALIYSIFFRHQRFDFTFFCRVHAHSRWGHFVGTVRRGWAHAVVSEATRTALTIMNALFFCCASRFVVLIAHVK